MRNVLIEIKANNQSVHCFYLLEKVKNLFSLNNLEFCFYFKKKKSLLYLFENLKISLQENTAKEVDFVGLSLIKRRRCTVWKFCCWFVCGSRWANTNCFIDYGIYWKSLVVRQWIFYRDIFFSYITITIIIIIGAIISLLSNWTLQTKLVWASEDLVCPHG